MIFEVTETIFTYPSKLLEEWKNGDKGWVPESLFVPQDVHNQPNYHFGEYYALKKYLEQGWQGTAFMLSEIGNQTTINMSMVEPWFQST